MLEYKDIDPGKKAFVFELDNVLYPEKDYLLQVYYLFANFVEFTEGHPPAADLTAFLKTAYTHHGDEGIFYRAKEAFGLDDKYKENLERLYYTARLPLKLLLYDHILSLLQEIIIDRKQIILITNGKTGIQLNKIRQLEWAGTEKYLKVYFAEESKLKPEIDVLTYIMKDYGLLRRDILIFGASNTDEEFALAAGIDYINPVDFQ